MGKMSIEKMGWEVMHYQRCVIGSKIHSNMSVILEQEVSKFDEA